MTVEAATDKAMDPDATEAGKQVTAAAEVRAVLTLVQATAAAPSRVDSVMPAEALVEDAMNADATEAEKQATAAAPSRVDSVMTAQALADGAINADATGVHALVIATTEASAALTRWS